MTPKCVCSLPKTAVDLHGFNPGFNDVVYEAETNVPECICGCAMRPVFHRSLIPL